MPPIAAAGEPSRQRHSSSSRTREEASPKPALTGSACAVRPSVSPVRALAVELLNLSPGGKADTAGAQQQSRLGHSSVDCNSPGSQAQGQSYGFRCFVFTQDQTWACPTAAAGTQLQVQGQQGKPWGAHPATAIPNLPVPPGMLTHSWKQTELLQQLQYQPCSSSPVQPGCLRLLPSTRVRTQAGWWGAGGRWH